MYIPSQFREDSIPVIHEGIRQSRLASLVTAAGDLVATPLPLMLDPEPAPYGTLIGHVAKANPQWRVGRAPALAIFMGPDAYVSPSWYPTKARDGKVVPTWNYVAIHAYGTAEFFDDRDRLLDVVTRLTRHHEETRATPWAVSDAPDEFIRAQLKGIVGLRLTIERLEAKWKMSQNRNAADRNGVAAGLGASDIPREQEVSAMVLERAGISSRQPD